MLNDGGTVYSGILAGWDVSGLPGGLNNYGPSPYAPTTHATNVAVIGLTRGSGVRTSGTAAAGAWGGVAFTNTTASAAIASNQFVTFSLTASNGYKVSFTTISRFDYYRSGTSPNAGLLQYRIGSGAFSDITNLSYPVISSGASIGAIDLSGIAALQDVGGNTNVTFRIVNFGGTSSAGTWYVYNTAITTAPDLALVGTVTQVLPPAIAPVIWLSSFTNNQFQFTLTGSAGALRCTSRHQPRHARLASGRHWHCALRVHYNECHRPFAAILPRCQRTMTRGTRFAIQFNARAPTARRILGGTRTGSREHKPSWPAILSRAKGKAGDFLLIADD